MELLQPHQVTESPGLQAGDGVVGEVEGGEVGQVSEGGGRDGGDVGVGDGQPGQVQALEAEGGDVLKVWPVVDLQPRRLDSLRKFWSSRAVMLR